MEFEILDTFDNPVSQEIFSTYSQSFPADEIRNQEQFSALFDKENVNIFSIKKNNDRIGYIVVWELSDFAFLEHLEIFQSFRKQGLGSEILQLLKTKYKKVVLETEPENTNEFANYRIDFYYKNDFRVLTIDYTQPPYDENKNPVDLWLLGNFKVKNPNKIVSQIYHEVYEK